MGAPNPPADTGELSNDRNSIGTEWDAVCLLAAHFFSFFAMPSIVNDEVSLV
jgi:hypothetical protein